MTNLNSSDVKYSFVKEVTAGTTPTSPAFVTLDHISGTRPTFSTTMSESQVVKAGRAAGRARKNDPSVGGGFATELAHDAAIFLLMSSALSNTWVAGEDDDYILKGGASDQSFTIEERFGGATPLLGYYKGVQASTMTIAGNPSALISANFDIVGLGYATAASAPAGSTYAAASNDAKNHGLDANIEITGLTNVDYSSFELKVEQNKQIQRVLGKYDGAGVATEGSRKVSGNVKFYRTNMTPETLFAGNNTVSIKITTMIEGKAFEFLIPAAMVSQPQSEEDGASMLVSLDFQGSLDPVTGTDIMITRSE